MNARGARSLLARQSAGSHAVHGRRGYQWARLHQNRMRARCVCASFGTHPSSDAGAEADPTPPPARPAQAARLLPVERPRQLWQLDMTSIWVAEHGWTYLNAIIDCGTREAGKITKTSRPEPSTPEESRSAGSAVTRGVGGGAGRGSREGPKGASLMAGRRRELIMFGGVGFLDSGSLACGVLQCIFDRCEHAESPETCN